MVLLVAQHRIQSSQLSMLTYRTYAAYDRKFDYSTLQPVKSGVAEGEAVLPAQSYLLHQGGKFLERYFFCDVARYLSWIFGDFCSPRFSRGVFSPPIYPVLDLCFSRFVFYKLFFSSPSRGL